MMAVVDWAILVGRSAAIITGLYIVYQVAWRKRGDRQLSWFALSALLFAVLNIALSWTAGVIRDIVQAAWVAVLFLLIFVLYKDIAGMNKELIKEQDELIELQGKVIADQEQIIAFYRRREIVVVPSDGDESEVDDD